MLPSTTNRFPRVVVAYQQSNTLPIGHGIVSLRRRRNVTHCGTVNFSLFNVNHSSIKAIRKGKTGNCKNAQIKSVLPSETHVMPVISFTEWQAVICSVIVAFM